MVQEVDDANRRTSEYHAGRNAFKRGKKVNHCPHVSGLKRISWLIGWYDEQTWSRLWHIFRRHRITWT